MADVKVSPDKHISWRVDRENLIYIRWNRLMIDRGKWSKTITEVKPAKNTSNNPQGFLETGPARKEVLFHIKCKSMHTRQHPFGLTENKLPELNESSKFFSHRARMSGEFDSRKDSHSTKVGQRTWIFVKLSFREMSDSKLSQLHPFDNMAKIHWVKNRSNCEFMRHQSLI